MANNSGSHRTGSSPSSRYNSGNNQRPASYSERYNRPNPYTGYLPPGVSSSEQIYHPESVDPVRVKQLEREQEQARLHAYEDKANMPHSETVRSQGSVQRQQRTQTTRQQVSRGTQETTRRSKQTRRAQVAQQQAARASSAYRPAVTVGNDAHLNEIRQNAIDEAERLRSQPIEVHEAPAMSEPMPAAPVEEAPKKNLTEGLPVAGAAQFAAMNMKNAETEHSSDTDVVVAPVIINEPDSTETQPEAEVIPVVIPAPPIEVITPDAPEEVAEETEVIPEEESAPVTEEAPTETFEEETQEPMEEAPAEEETVEESVIEETEEIADIPLVTPDELLENTEVTEEAETEEVAETAEEVEAEPEVEVIPEEEIIPEEEPIAEEAVSEEPEEVIQEEETAEPPTEEAEQPEESAFEESEAITTEVIEETEVPEEPSQPEEDEDEDIKVYVSPEKKAEEPESTDEFDEDYYEYEDDETDAEEVVTSIPSAPAAPATRRRSFETRISPELADPSAYSPGVAQDETLFIRKKRPEEATAVFAATTPGLAPDFDDDDFFEQWLEEGDDMIIKDKRQRRRVSAIIGGATMIFAIIGFIFVVVWFVKGIPSGSTSTGSQTDYASFILPVVNADPEPFETISSVDNNILVEAAINRLTYGEAAADHSYTALEVENETRLLIPSSDVEESGRVLFGDEFAIDYTNMYTIEDEKIYYYSAADDCFHVITTSGDIEPEIIKISHIGSRTQVLLEVGYLSTTEETADDSEYYKKMEYVLNAVEGGYYVSAIRAIEE